MCKGSGGEGFSKTLRKEQESFAFRRDRGGSNGRPHPGSQQSIKLNDLRNK